MIERSDAESPRTPRLSRSRKAAMVIAVAAVSAGAVSIATADDDPPPPTSPSAAPMVTAISSAQSAAFAVFRTAGGGTAEGHGPFGANLALGREVDTPAGTVTVVPANGTVCLRAEDTVGAGWTCAPTDVAASHVLMLSLRPQDGTGDVTVFGLVPDAAGSAQLSTAAGTEALTLNDGVFGTTVDAQTAASVITEGAPEQRVP